MSQFSFAVDLTLTTINCGECGGTYAINERYRAQKAESGGSWTCPYCKTGWGYENNNENARLKKNLEEEKKRKNDALARANEAVARADAAENTLNKHKNRMKNGVCPCCKRTFKALAAHMKNKHPNFTVKP